MRHKFSLILTLFAWLIATGSQLDAVQAFAWLKMFTANVQEMPFAAAVQRTFSPAGRCRLCVAVAQAKQKQEDPAGAPAEKKFGAKLVLVFQPASEMFVEVSSVADWPNDGEEAWSAGRAAPPLPPPRVRAV